MSVESEIDVSSEALQILETLQSKAPVGFGFVDRDFRIVRLNEAMAAAFGLTDADPVGRLVRDVVPAVWPLVAPILRSVLAD